MQMQAARTSGISIDGITNDGVSQLGQMGPQLMGAPREGAQPDPRAVGTSSADLPKGERQTALGMGAVARGLA